MPPRAEGEYSIHTAMVTAIETPWFLQLHQLRRQVLFPLQKSLLCVGKLGIQLLFALSELVPLGLARVWTGAGIGLGSRRERLIEHDAIGTCARAAR
jgi:hypothetical protein